MNRAALLVTLVKVTVLWFVLKYIRMNNAKEW